MQKPVAYLYTAISAILVFIFERNTELLHVK